MKEALIAIPILVALIVYILAANHYCKDDNSGTHSYGYFAIGLWFKTLPITIGSGLITFLVLLIIGVATGRFECG